jgi:hypothetical protein
MTARLDATSPDHCVNIDAQRILNQHPPAAPSAAVSAHVFDAPIFRN